MPKRKLSNWLEGLKRFVEETEAPRDFWLWGGIFTITSAMQRKIWLPYGLKPLYPNLYILLVAPPGKCRKGGPPELAKKMLRELNIPVAKDSSSKRAITKELAAITDHFAYNGKNWPQSPLAIISKEMSSLLAVDPKGVIEVLTDLYDSHDIWEYGTSEKGEDVIHGVCVGCFVVTTPTWLAANLPSEAIGGGYTSRHAIVTGYDKYKWVPIPPDPKEVNPGLYEALIHDLNTITMLIGEFEWGPGSEDYFSKWYRTLGEKVDQTKDERLHGFIERMHVMVLKVTMALRVAYSDELILTVEDLTAATILLDSILKTSSDALGGHGRSRTAIDVEKILRQIKAMKKTTLRELLQMNFRNTNKSELLEILETIEGMGHIKVTSNESGEVTCTWKG